ncbi:MAG: DNA polymerase sliding clamp [Desulfurococcales archaeon]|nr:DNA polymerase sliding clamp [Desulfurococcales archaeon]MCE4605295.1 DNA polymerase sliding clamp [Desulfurococcales archaeon]
MFRVVYPAASKFKYITQTLAKINDEGIIGFTLDSMIAWIMSPDKTSLAILRAPPMSFDEYTIEEEARFTIRTDELNKIMKRATRNDDLIIEYRAEDEVLMVTLVDRKTGMSRSFTLPITEASPSELREPKFESTARFIMIADDFKQAIQDAKVVGDYLTFEADDDQLVVRSEAEERSYEWIMKIGDPLIELEVDEHTRSSYTRTALETATKPTGAAENVRVEYATDYPMKIEFTFPNTEKMYLYIAPSLD